ncbi:alpha/beta fold hydrolase [Rhizobacter sp. P5_C2]
MKAPLPHPGRLAAHSQGDGPVVLCLHSSTGTHAQWNGLADALSERWQVVAPDLHGHGRSPAWPSATLNTLHVDANAVTQLMQPAWGLVRRGIHLVGHSYGAAVALQIALRHPQWVRSLTLYEPVAVGIIRRMAPQDPSLAEVREIASRVARLLEQGDALAAACAFTTYWGGDAAWDGLSPARREAIAARMPVVPHHFDALFSATWGPQVLSRLAMPLLLIHGERTRAPARRIVELLADALPQAQRCELAGAGHLGPITHAATVVRWMATHLDPVAASRLDLQPQAA